MKKVIYILIISLAVGTFLIGCDDNAYKEPVKTLEVISSDLYFPWDGGEGTITMKADGKITPTSSQVWCTVHAEGNVVYVSVSMNDKYSGRTARVTITSGNESTYVAVTQRPAAFTIDALNMTIGDKEGTSSFAASSSVDPISASTEDTWILNPRYENGKVIFDHEANPDATRRTGHISVTAGPITHKVAITQDNSGFATFLGDWNMEYAETDSTVYNRTLTFKTKVLNESFIVSGLDLDYEFEIGYREDERMLVLPGQYLGKYEPEDTEYELFLYPVNSLGKGYAQVNESKYTYYGVHVMGDIENPVYGFVDRGELGVQTIEGMALVGRTGTSSADYKYTRFYTYMRWTIVKPEKKE